MRLNATVCLIRLFLALVLLPVYQVANHSVSCHRELPGSEVGVQCHCPCVPHLAFSQCPGRWGILPFSLQLFGGFWSEWGEMDSISPMTVPSMLLSCMHRAMTQLYR